MSLIKNAHLLLLLAPLFASPFLACGRPEESNLKQDREVTPGWYGDEFGDALLNRFDEIGVRESEHSSRGSTTVIFRFDKEWDWRSFLTQVEIDIERCAFEHRHYSTMSERAPSEGFWVIRCSPGVVIRVHHNERRQITAASITQVIDERLIGEGAVDFYLSDEFVPSNYRG